MGKLVEKSEGYYLLNVKVGSVEIEKAFMDADKPLEEISKLPMPENGFCLIIPDDKEN